MPATTPDDDREKFDHSGHPTDDRVSDDLKAPGGGGLDHPEGRRRAAVQERGAKGDAAADPAPGIVPTPGT